MLCEKSRSLLIQHGLHALATQQRSLSQITVAAASAVADAAVAGSLGRSSAARGGPGRLSYRTSSNKRTDRRKLRRTKTTTKGKKALARVTPLVLGQRSRASLHHRSVETKIGRRVAQIVAGQQTWARCKNRRLWRGSPWWNASYGEAEDVTRLKKK